MNTTRDTVKLKTPCDLTHTGVAEAICELAKRQEFAKTLVASANENHDEARDIAARYNLELIFLPLTMFKSEDSWALAGPHTTIWSNGAI